MDIFNKMKYMLIVVPALGIMLLGLNIIIGFIYAADSEKVSAYECGFSPLGETREKFNISFYLIGIVFLIFDLEIILALPLISSILTLETGLTSYWVVILFIIILTIGYIYEWKSGVLDEVGS